MPERTLPDRELGVATLEVDNCEYWLVGCDYPAEGVRKVWFQRALAGAPEGETLFELTEALTGPQQHARPQHAERTLELAVQVLDGFLPEASAEVHAERAKLNVRLEDLVAQGMPRTEARQQARADWLRSFLAG